MYAGSCEMLPALDRDVRSIEFVEMFSKRRKKNYKIWMTILTLWSACYVDNKRRITCLCFLALQTNPHKLGRYSVVIFVEVSCSREIVNNYVLDTHPHHFLVLQLILFAITCGTFCPGK